ncbi:hypothetical protein BD560DRAFT_486853 [Blakeslea trispora]|nr:hypothetical protein BD560DRAFT_486853 [Blakeslea trispora]
MPSVMDISHLLCQPCDPYMSNKLTNCNFYDSPPESPITPPETTNSSPFFVHRPVPVVFNDNDFWKHHRLLSTASDDVTFGHYYPTEPEKPKPSYRKRMNSEMVSVSFHHATSDPFVLTQPPKGRKMSSNSTHARRNRSNSTPMIQTRVPWTPEEDDLLQKGYEQGLSWAMISCNFLPHRSRGCCWGRFKTLQNKNAIEVYQQRICQRPWRINRPHQQKAIKK